MHLWRPTPDPTRLDLISHRDIAARRHGDEHALGIMLTSSPVVSAPSPRSLHYVTTRSPLPSPSHRAVAPLPRRLSKQSLSHSPPPTTSMSAPPPPASPSSHQAAQTNQYVAVDAATQYSPTDPFDPRVPLRAAEGPCPRRSTSTTMTQDAATTTTTEHTPAPVPGIGIDVVPKTVVGSGPSGIAAAVNALHVNNGTPNVAVTEAPEAAPAVPLATNPLSPSKRRKSIEESIGTATHPSTSVVVSSLPSSPKRSKPNQGPPKALPLKYELCDVEDMVILIANMLSELIETNDSIAMKSGQLTRFHSRYELVPVMPPYLKILEIWLTLTTGLPLEYPCSTTYSAWRSMPL